MRGQQRGFTLIELMITVSIIGILAAIAIPSFVIYIRSSKIVEVHGNLDRCYKGVLGYFYENRALEDGRVTAGSVPPKMTRWLCPGKNLGKLKDLDGSARFIDPRAYERDEIQVFKDIGFVITDATYACYRYNTNVSETKPLANGRWIRCMAYTDVDDDDVYARWYKTGTYRSKAGMFQAGHVYQVPPPTGDDW